jgi:hypothetical protein
MIPLELLDGTKIDTSTGAVIKSAQPPKTSVEVIPSHSEAVEKLKVTQKKLTDLPMLPKHMNGVASIVSYTLFGLEDEEIATALQVPVNTIYKIKSGVAYEEMYSTVLKQIVDGHKASVEAIISSNLRQAANKLVEHMQSEEAGISLAATRDLLDRGGFRPADRVVHEHKFDEMRIRYIEETEDTLIDVTPDEQ